MSKQVPDILIEQYALGELSSEEARRVEQSTGFQARLDAVLQSNAAILDEYPPDAFAVRIQNRAAADATLYGQHGVRPNPRRARWVANPRLAAPLGILATAILAIGGWYFGFGRTTATPGTPSEITRIKGGEPTLLVYRNRPGAQAPERLADGAAAVRGDQLQLAYNAAGMPYGAILSLDGSGSVTLHYPLSVSSEADLAQGGEQQLPYGYQLDDAPDFERFYLIASETPFDVRTVVARFRSQAAVLAANPDRHPDIGDGFTVIMLTLEKGE